MACIQTLRFCAKYNAREVRDPSRGDSGRPKCDGSGRVVASMEKENGIMKTKFGARDAGYMRRAGPRPRLCLRSLIYRQRHFAGSGVCRRGAQGRGLGARVFETVRKESMMIQGTQSQETHWGFQRKLCRSGSGEVMSCECVCVATQAKERYPSALAASPQDLLTVSCRPRRDPPAEEEAGAAVGTARSIVQRVSTVLKGREESAMCFGGCGRLMLS
jgi:hypothetical protein